MANLEPRGSSNQAASCETPPHKLSSSGVVSLLIGHPTAHRSSQDEFRAFHILPGDLMAIPQSWQGPDHVLLSAETSEKDIYFFCKRCADVCLAAVALILLLPLLLLIALLVKIDSSGPVLFTHERVGAKRLQVRGEAVWVVGNFRMH